MSDNTSLRVVFMGSPDMAIPTLEALAHSPHQIVGIVSQPDKPVGRGLEMTSPAVAVWAKEKNIPLFQPEKVKENPDFFKTLQDLKPDVIVVVAYGKILPAEILTLPPHRCINVHFSLLPKYRGAAPMQWAIMNGELETGVTTFFLMEKVDDGPILMQKKTSIEPEENTPILARRLSQMGADLLIQTLDGLLKGEIEPRHQNHREATLAPILKKEVGLIDWNQKATIIHNQVRALQPWPGCTTFWKGQRVKIHKTEVVPKKANVQAGEVIDVLPQAIEVACRMGVLAILELQVEGKKKMEVSEFLKGNEILMGERFGS